MLKAGYHIVNYNETLGYDNFTFHGRPFEEVVTEFMFWLAVFSGGVGIITDTSKGLILGLTSLIICSIVTTFFFLAASNKIVNHSRNIGINDVTRKMTNLEQWEYIYKDSAHLLVLGIIILLVINIIYKRRKSLNKVIKAAYNRGTVS